MAGKTFCRLALDTLVSTRSQSIFAQMTGMMADAFCLFSLAAWSTHTVNHLTHCAPVDEIINSDEFPG